jgi:hypothetical protein
LQASQAPSGSAKSIASDVRRGSTIGGERYSETGASPQGAFSGSCGGRQKNAPGVPRAAFGFVASGHAACRLRVRARTRAASVAKRANGAPSLRAELDVAQVKEPPSKLPPSELGLFAQVLEAPHVLPVSLREVNDDEGLRLRGDAPCSRPERFPPPAFRCRCGESNCSPRRPDPNWKVANGFSPP